MSLYDDLRRDYPDLREDISGSEARGNATYPEPFSPMKKSSWRRDTREELADALLYIRADLALLEAKRRTCARTRHTCLTLSALERSIVRGLRELNELNSEWKHGE